MKLTTEQALDYFQGFTRLDGYPRAVVTPSGPQIILESYDLSPKVKWRAAMNRNFLRTVKDAFEEQRKAEQKKFDDLKASLDPKLEQAERDAILEKATHESNVRLADLGKQENDIPGLLKLPGEGIRIRARDPGIIAILDLLMKDFIEGEPDYGQTRSAAEPKE